MYTDKNFTEGVRKIIVSSTNTKFYNDSLKREGNKKYMLEFVIDNIPKISEIVDLKELIDSFYIEKANNAYGTKFYKLIFRITKVLSEKHNGQYLQDYYIKILDYINKATVENKVDVLKTLAIIVNKDYITQLRTGESLCQFTQNDLLVKEIKGTNVEIIKGIINDSFFILLGSFYNFVTEVIKIFEEERNENCFIFLKAINKVIGLEKFYDFIKYKSEENIRKYTEILKKGRNTDLDFLIYFYGDCVDNKKVFYSIFSCVTHFCTDKNNKINLLMKIIQKELESGETKNITNIALGLTNIINTHTKYRNGNIILKNSISKEETNNILNTIITKDFIKCFVNLYMINSAKEISTLISCMIDNYQNKTELNFNDIFYALIEIVGEIPMNYFKEDSLIKCCKNYYDLINVAIFFVPHIKPDFHLATKILSLCLSIDQKEQKLAYKFITQLIKHKKTEICLCASLIANDYSQVYTCTRRNRILCLYESYISCDKCNDKKDFFKKMQFELIICLRDNSSKGRKTSVDLLEKMITQFTYKDFLLLIFAGLGSDDYKIINGSITCLIFFIKNKKVYIENNIDLIISQAKLLQNKGKECHKSVLDLYKTIILELKCDIDGFLNLISNFSMCKRKKTCDYLRNIAIELKNNNIQITQEMNRLIIT
ncbi:hypothetical protein COBT_001502 [Conglomerata obtusa]